LLPLLATLLSPLMPPPPLPLCLMPRESAMLMPFYARRAQVRVIIQRADDASAAACECDMRRACSGSAAEVQ